MKKVKLYTLFLFSLLSLICRAQDTIVVTVSDIAINHSHYDNSFLQLSQTSKHYVYVIDLNGKYIYSTKSSNVVLYNNSIRTVILNNDSLYNALRQVIYIYRATTIYDVHLKFDSTQIRAGGNGILIQAPPPGYCIMIVSGVISYHYRTVPYVQVGGCIQISYNSTSSAVLTTGQLSLSGVGMTATRNNNAFGYYAYYTGLYNLESVPIYWNINGVFTLGNGYVTIDVLYRIVRYTS